MVELVKRQKGNKSAFNREANECKDVGVLIDLPTDFRAPLGL